MNRAASLGIFHLAIPVGDLIATEAFYEGVLGCLVARRYEDRITLNFHGAQVVCHLSPAQTPPEPRLYPRHFGLTFHRRVDFDHLYERTRHLGVVLQEVFVRFEGRPEEHLAFFLVDPSNNVLEFKHYRDPAMMY